MNCISCGSPEIKYEFIHEDLERGNYFCERVTCYFEFLQLFQIIEEKKCHIFSFDSSIKNLIPIASNKNVRKCYNILLFFEELEEKRPDVYFKNDNMIEFYLRYLNDHYQNEDKRIIGPVTMRILLGNSEEFKIFTAEKELNFQNFLIISRNSDNDFGIFLIRKNKIQNKLDNNTRKLMIETKKDKFLQKMFEILIEKKILDLNFSNLELINFKKNKIEKGSFICQFAEEFMKGSDKKINDMILKSDKEMMEIINKLINSL